MATASDKSPGAQIVLCGQGRIGGALLEKLNSEAQKVCCARLDPSKGLYRPSGQLPSQIDLLIICISAGHKSSSPPRWHWQEIFGGLAGQIHRQQLAIKNIVMVSSTRVYDAISQGLVTAQTPPSPQSPQAKGLTIAEQTLLALPAKVRIIRASGLYGSEYPVYHTILKAGEAKPRFGVDSAAVVEALYRSTRAVNRGDFSSQIDLLTDGGVYYQRECYFWPEDRSQLEMLARSHRILLNSTAPVTAFD